MQERDKLVIGLLRTVLGKAAPSTKGNYAFFCPFCKHYKPKLEVNPVEGMWHCWVCDQKGRTPVSLLRKLEASPEAVAEMKSYFPVGHKEVVEKVSRTVHLPKEFISLSKPSTKLSYRQAKAYLHKRGITDEDIIKYNLGYCETGKYANRIILPSYDKQGVLNYFVARSFEKDPARAYDSPPCDKDALIGLEYYINWNVPVILCEGYFDAMAFRRNAVPLFGKLISKALMLKLVHQEVKTVYLALDKDALKKALQHSQTLLDLGKDVYLIDLKDKDPSKIGFEQLTKQLHEAKQLTFGDLLLKKIELHG